MRKDYVTHAHTHTHINSFLNKTYKSLKLNACAHTHTKSTITLLYTQYITLHVVHYMYVCIYVHTYAICLSSPTHSLQLVNNIDDLLLLQCHSEYEFFLFEPHNWLFQIVCVPIMFWYFESLLYIWGIYLSFSFPPFLILYFPHPPPSLSTWLLHLFTK